MAAPARLFCASASESSSPAKDTGHTRSGATLLQRHLVLTNYLGKDPIPGKVTFRGSECTQIWGELCSAQYDW